jgi:hypothetical protein
LTEDPLLTRQATIEAMRVRRGKTTVVLVAVGACLAGIGLGIGLRQSPALDPVLGTRIDVERAEQIATARADTSLRYGRAQGDAAGYDRGFDVGRDDGLADGDAAGYERGYDEGFERGADMAYAGAGTTIKRVEWSYNIGDDSDEGICVYFKGDYVLSEWRWVFTDGGTPSDITDSFFDEAATNWCYTKSYLVSQIGGLSNFDTLTVYVTRDGKTDRWGPKRVPSG